MGVGGQRGLSEVEALWVWGDRAVGDGGQRGLGEVEALWVSGDRED